MADKREEFTSRTITGVRVTHIVWQKWERVTEVEAASRSSQPRPRITKLLHACAYVLVGVGLIWLLNAVR